MSDVSTFRLYVLRATYLLLAVGIALMVWPLLIDHTSAWAGRNGATFSLLAGVQVLSILGLLHPLRMLPLLVFEFTWKSIWMITIALPLWRAGAIDANFIANLWAIGSGVVICGVAIPWPYFLRSFVIAPGDRWGSSRSAGETKIGR